MHHRGRGPFTRVGVVCVEEVDLLSSIPVHVTGRDPDGIPCCVPQGVERGVTVIHGDVHESILGTVVLQHQVRPLVPVGTALG